MALEVALPPVIPAILDRFTSVGDEIVISEVIARETSTSSVIAEVMIGSRVGKRKNEKKETTRKTETKTLKPPFKTLFFDFRTVLMFLF